MNFLPATVCHWLCQCSSSKTLKRLQSPVAEVAKLQKFAQFLRIQLRGVAPNPTEAGFTLLEVILSLAILAGSLAALGEVMRLADRNAALSRDETQAQIIASSIMDELVSGYRELTAENQAVFDPTMDPPWLYSIAIENTSYVELVTVRVLVEQQMEAQLQPARFELVRWLADPDYLPPATGDEQSGSSSTSSGSSGASSSSSSFGGGAGGQP